MQVHWSDRLLNAIFSHYDNKNSLTRDELANERSFLAYIRCSMTILVSSFSITQIVLQLVILSVHKILIIDDNNLNSNLSYNLFLDYYNNLNDYKKFFKPIGLFLCAISLFVSCLGLKKSWLNFYNLAERAKFQPGLIGMGLLFLSLFIIDIVLLKTCISFGLREFK